MSYIEGETGCVLPRELGERLYRALPPDLLDSIEAKRKNTPWYEPRIEVEDILNKIEWRDEVRRKEDDETFSALYEALEELFSLWLNDKIDVTTAANSKLGDLYSRFDKTFGSPPRPPITPVLLAEAREIALAVEKIMRRYMKGSK